MTDTTAGEGRWSDYPEWINGTPEMPVGSPEWCAVATDKIEGLTEDLLSAVKTAYQRGAVEWTRLNYPQWFAHIAAQPSAGAQGEAVAWVFDEYSPAHKSWLFRASRTKPIPHTHIRNVVPLGPLMSQDHRAFVNRVGRLPHPADDDYAYPEDIDAEREMLNGLIADAREIMSATPAQPDAGDVAALREALKSAEPMLETLHSVVTAPDVRKSVWAVVKQVRAALSKPNAQQGTINYDNKDSN